MGVIHPSKSHWASPLYMVSKSGGTWHTCGDYRALDSAIKPDCYRISHVHDVTAVIQDKVRFYKIRPYQCLPSNSCIASTYS